MHKKLCLLLAGFFCSGLFIAQAATTQQTQASAGAGQTQMQSPVNQDKFNFVIANPNNIDPKRFIFELKPGTQNSDFVYVKNAADVPLKFSLYGTDGTKTATGTFALKTKNETQENVGKWTTFDEPEFTLQPGEIRKEKFTIAIPTNAPEGSYSGGLAAEKSKADLNNPNVIIAVRIGIRVDVKVTANPQTITKKYPDVGGNPFFQAYFWASLGLFVLSAGALGWSYYKEKPKHAGKHKGKK